MKAARQKCLVTYSKASIRLTENLSSEIRETRRHWGDIWSAEIKKYCQSIILYPVKLSFKGKGEIRTFTG